MTLAEAILAGADEEYANPGKDRDKTRKLMRDGAKYIADLEAAIRAITFRDRSSGAICNSYVEDADLREYAPLLEQVHN